MAGRRKPSPVDALSYMSGSLWLSKWPGAIEALSPSSLEALDASATQLYVGAAVLFGYVRARREGAPHDKAVRAANRERAQARRRARFSYPTASPLTF